MKDTKKILQEHGFVLKKKFGQNFISDDQILKDIVANAGITEQDVVIEIGPGAGALTRKLAEVAKQVIAVEIDESLKPILEQTLSAFPRAEVIFQDVLKWDLKSYLEANYPGERIKVVANLPYYITTPILMKLLEEKMPLQSITIMVQKEVADRMQAKPGGKDYGALTLAVAYYARAEIVMMVPPHIFLPPPKVMSAVIHLRLKAAKSLTNEEKAAADSVHELTDKEEKELFRVIAASFEQRRKTLINALANKGIADKSEIKPILAKMGLEETIRGERLSLEQFMELSRLLHK